MAERDENEPPKEKKPREKTEEEKERDRLLEEEAKFKTLDDYKKEIDQKVREARRERGFQREQPKFDTRKPSDNQQQFGKLVKMNKERQEDEIHEETVVVVRHRGMRDGCSVARSATSLSPSISTSRTLEVVAAVDAELMDALEAVADVEGRRRSHTQSPWMTSRP